MTNAATSRVRICFVCLGNICRSPTAQAVMEHLVADAGLRSLVHVASAGTGGWHIGDSPDRRAMAEADRRGITMRSHAQQFEPSYFDRFDYIVAMDDENVTELRRQARTDRDLEKIAKLRAFDPDVDGEPDVPDPYYGGPDGFAHVFDMVEAACEGLLAHVRRAHLE